MSKEKITALEKRLKTIHHNHTYSPPSSRWQQQVMTHIKRESALSKPCRGISFDLSKLLWPLLPVTFCMLFMALQFYTSKGLAVDMDIMYWTLKRPLDMEYLYLSSLF